MAVNMCRRDFGTVVTTGAVSADGYEVENLLGKTDMWGQPKGFVAERFIKPPVDVTFMFPLNLWIQKILIDPKVGAQMSGALEVFTASVAMPPCEEIGHGRSSLKGNTRTSNANQKPNLRSPSQMLSEKDGAVFSSIGKAFSADGETARFCFVNHSYEPMYPQIGNIDPRHHDDTKPGVVTRALRYARPGALTNASHITVRVNRVAFGSVAIRSVQIWGQPSVVCSKSSVQWFLQVVNPVENPKLDRKQREQVPVAGVEQRGACHSVASSGRKALESCKRTDTPDCPEEFLDPITNEMLVLPILLPSGHTVDSETLRKHSEAEALWGRPPNDPFTGIPFSKGRQPLPNVKLKQRLDRYLLKGDGSVVPSARDVGRSGGAASGKTIPTPASLVRIATQQNKSSVNTDSEELQCIRPGKTQKFQPLSRHCSSSKASTSKLTTQPGLMQMDTLRSGRGPKRSLQVDQSFDRMPLSKKRPSSRMPRESSWASAQISNSLSASASPSPSPPPPPPPPAAAATTVAAARASTSSHEELLAQSLDTALESALSSLPTFSDQPAQESSSLEDNLHHNWSCSSCHKTVATREGYHVNGPLNMYTLPCDHLVCRECLSPPRGGKTSGKCSICQRRYRHSEVTKVHV